MAKGKKKEQAQEAQKVSAVLVKDEQAVAALIPKTLDDFNKALPESREECFHILTANFVYMQRQNTLRMWHVGKVLKTLQDRGEENVFEEATKITGYKSSALYMAVSLFVKFPDPQYISDVGKVLSWGNVRQILAVNNPDKRKKLCDEVLEGKLTNNNAETLINAVKEEERAAKKADKDEKEEDPEDPEKGPVGAPSTVKVKPAAVLTKIETYMLNTVKNLQEYEAEYVEIMKYIWDPDMVVDQGDFKKYTDIAERVVQAVDKLKTEVTAMKPVFQKLLDNDPHKAM